MGKRVKGPAWGTKAHRIAVLRNQYLKNKSGRRWQARTMRKYAKAGRSPSLVRGSW